MPRKKTPLSRSVVLVDCITIKFAYRGNLHRPNIGLCKLLFSAKLEACLFDGILKGGFVNIIVTMPLHAKFLACDIGFGGEDSIQAQRSLFDAGLAMAAVHTKDTICFNNRFFVFMMMLVAMAFTFMMMLVMMFMMFAMSFAFTMFVVIITFATTIVISAATATMSAATLVSKLGINNQQREQSRTDIIQYAQGSMTMTFCRSVRKHRRKECIHKERIDDESEEQCSKRNGGQVRGQGTLAKSLSNHEHARNTRCRARHQEHERGTRRNALFNQSKCKRNGTRRAGVHRHCKHQHNYHAKQRVFVQEQEEIVRNKGRNQRTQQKANDEPLAHIANHVHETVFESFLNLLGKGLFQMFFIVVLSARAMVTIAITMFVFMVMFMMFVRFAHNSNTRFRLIFCNYIRKQSTKHRRHESGYRA